MVDLELCYASAEELARRVRARELSPVEVVENTLARLDQTEPGLNAFVSVDREGARATARAAERAVLAGDEVGPLHGVPVSVKDLIEATGMACTYGSLTMAGYVPAEDAPAVARLRAAGAIVIGKTTTSELGLRGYTESLVHGVTRNVWDLARTPGGSSGGAVTSVAAGVTPIALGTDGGGSIRAPCALTGLFGVKTQHGRVPIWPASATPSIAHVGPIARSSADSALVLRVIAGPDLRDHTSLLPPLGALDAPLPRRLRIAFSPTLGYAQVDPEVAAIVRSAVQKLGAALADIEEVDRICPDSGHILAAEFLAGLSGRLGDAVERAPERLDPNVLAALTGFRQWTAVELAARQRERVLHRERLWRFFERFDLLLTPTTPVAAWELGPGVPPGLEDAPAWPFFTYPFNLSGQPAGTVPCGFTSKGLPVGLQIVVRPLEEPLLLAIMQLAEDALGGARKRPPWPPRQRT